eukprot:gene5690-7855_t
MSQKRKVTTIDSSSSMDNHVISGSTVTIPKYCPVDFNMNRVRTITNSNNLNVNGKSVVLWMSRDQRVHDNHALIYAQSLAIEYKVPLHVIFNLVPTFLQATLRQYDFMLEGLKEVESDLRQRNIPFHLLLGDPVINIPAFTIEKNAIALIADFSPLRVGRMWIKSVGEKLDGLGSTSASIPLFQIDAHNIVPCWIASNKCEYGARTIRGKIQSLIPSYLTEFKMIVDQNYLSDNNILENIPPVNWTLALSSLQIDRTVLPVDWISPGPSAAAAMLESFINERLKDYEEKRNDPTCNNVSHLSPYIHFGQISVQRIVIRLKSLKKYPASVDNFIEEAVVRRELSENFCYYNPNYDSLEGCYAWARETLAMHANDPRPVLYSLEQLESAQTHDDLWNAAQIQMTKEGKMHGFLRMYWAKKILEWTPSPSIALSHAIFLNDKYELDGRDPNGYVGCMWSIAGVHDQGWGERAIFGKIRYMNYKGCERKFDVKKFVKKYPPASANAAAASGQTTLKFK